MVLKILGFMASPSLQELAYKTLQGSKNLAGLAHKGVSTKLMELLAPGVTPEVSPLQGELLTDLKKSMEELEKVDWKEAEQGLYPISQLSSVIYLLGLQDHQFYSQVLSFRFQVFRLIHNIST